MIHVYALTSAPLTLGGETGMDGQPLRTVGCPPLAAVVSDHDRPPAATRERVLTHARVVASVADRASALPVQFGAEHADETALRGAVLEREADLCRALGRVGGHVEVVVRFDGPEPPVPPASSGPPEPPPGDATVPADREGAGVAPEAGSGRAYLEQRRAREQHVLSHRRAAAQALRERTAPFEHLAAELLDRAGRYGPERCLLVQRGRLEELLAAARATLEAHDDLVLGGPWPPYTFADGAADA